MSRILPILFLLGILTSPINFYSAKRLKKASSAALTPPKAHNSVGTNQANKFLSIRKGDDDQPVYTLYAEGEQNMKTKTWPDNGAVKLSAQGDSLQDFSVKIGRLSLNVQRSSGRIMHDGFQIGAIPVGGTGPIIFLAIYREYPRRVDESSTFSGNLEVYISFLIGDDFDDHTVNLAVKSTALNFAEIKFQAQNAEDVKYYSTFDCAASSPGPTPRDAVLSPWTPYSACSAACGGGETERFKTVLFPAMGGGIEPEDTDLYEYTPCNTQPC